MRIAWFMATWLENLILNNLPAGEEVQIMPFSRSKIGPKLEVRKQPPQKMPWTTFLLSTISFFFLAHLIHSNPDKMGRLHHAQQLHAGPSCSPFFPLLIAQVEPQGLLSLCSLLPIHRVSFCRTIQHQIDVRPSLIFRPPKYFCCPPTAMDHRPLSSSLGRLFWTRHLLLTDCGKLACRPHLLSRPCMFHYLHALFVFCFAYCYYHVDACVVVLMFMLLPLFMILSY